MKEYIKRFVDINRLLDRKSVFLIGPRMCGKSMYAKNEVRKPELYWNLLSNTLYYRIVRNPALLEETLKAEGLTEGLVNPACTSVTVHSSSIYRRYGSSIPHDRLKCEETQKRRSESSWW